MQNNQTFESMKLNGQLVRVLLIPQEFGGEAIPDNTIWMYKAAALAKNRFDAELIETMRSGGDENWNYRAEPDYSGTGQIPTQLRVTASTKSGKELKSIIDNDPPNVRTASGAASNNLFDGVNEAGSVITFETLLMDNIAASFDKQLQLADYLGEGWRWDLDVQRGTLHLTKSNGQTLSVAVQLLGTESHITESWLWVWENAQSDIPSAVSASASRLQYFGQQNHIEEFTEAYFPLSFCTGELISMVASGIDNCRAYFCGPYEGGAVYMLINEKLQPDEKIHPCARITSVFPQLISSMEVLDHHRAFAAYTSYYGFSNQIFDNRVIATHPRAGDIMAEFDDLRRLTNIQARMDPIA